MIYNIYIIAEKDKRNEYSLKTNIHHIQFSYGLQKEHRIQTEHKTEKKTHDDC